MIPLKDMTTVGELREWLENMPGDSVVLLSVARGGEKRPMARAYQYGYTVDAGAYRDSHYSPTRAVTLL